MSGIAPVLARIASIDSRFGMPSPVRSQALGGPFTSDQLTEQGPGATIPPFGDALAAAEASLSPTGSFGRSDDSRVTFIGARPGAMPGTAIGMAASAPDAPTGTSGVPPGTPFAQEFATASDQHGVPGGLLAAVGWVESRYNVNALSPDGAIGVMQIMPGTAAGLGVDPRIPDEAIEGAARLLRSHHDRFGSWDLALAAYFSGAGAVANAGNQAPPRGAAYAQRVFQRMETQ